MNDLIKKLSILTFILFSISVITFINANRVSNDLNTGSDFIKGFNPTLAHKIVIKSDENKTITLRKEQQSYVMAEHYNYPANNEKINSLLFKIADIKVAEKVSGSKSDNEKYGVTNEKPKIEVQVFNDTETLVLNFLVGNDKNNKGNYIRYKEKSDIYLTDSRLTFSTDLDSYIKKEIPIQKSDNIENINAKFKGNRLEIIKKDNEFRLSRKNKKIKDESLKSYVTQLNKVKFQNFQPVNSTESVGLNFENQLTIMDKNKIITSIEIAQNNKKYFIKLSSSIKGAPKQITLSRNETDEKLKNIDDMIKAQKRSQEFNLSHSGWIYEINESTFNNLTTIK